MDTNNAARPMYLVRFADGTYLGTFTARTSIPNNAAVVARDAVKAAALAKAHGGEAVTLADAVGA